MKGRREEEETRRGTIKKGRRGEEETRRGTIKKRRKEIATGTRKTIKYELGEETWSNHQQANRTNIAASQEQISENKYNKALSY